MAVEYAPRGLLGVLTPQANTTVEPELMALLPPGIAMVNARMTSGKPDIVARLLDYLASLDVWTTQFANAPVGAIAFACTGASYYAGVAEEAAAVDRISAGRGVPFVTAGQAVRDAFHALGARRIGLVSPYPDDLTRAGIRYWKELGFDVAAVSGSVLQGKAFHPIYAMSGDGAHAALMAVDPAGLDAIVMLGTGMPTLAPILRTPFHGGVPVFSCMLALAWRSVCTLDGVAPGRENLLAWVRGEGWGERLQGRIATAERVGCARAAASAPMRPPAPVRFSTTTGWPSVSPMRSARMRAATSVEPPGAKGTIRRIGRFGVQAGCAARPPDNNGVQASADRMARRLMWRFIVGLPVVLR